MAVAGAARSGWRRGVVFFLIDLVGFAGAVFAAIRFHEIPALGFEVLGLDDRWAALAGGLAIFVPLIVATAMIGSRLSKAMYKPGLYTLDKVIGAAIAATFAAAVICVVILFVRAADLPFISNVLDGSAIASAATDLVQPCDERLERFIPEVCERPDEAG